MSRTERESKVTHVFGNGKQQKAIEAMAARLDAVESNVDRLVEERTKQLRATIQQHLDAIRREIEADPNVRLRALLDAAGSDLRRAVETALDDAQRVSSLRKEVEMAAMQVRDLDARLSGSGLGPPRKMEVGAIHRAEATGYVLVWHYSGTNGIIELRLGTNDPPDTLVARYGITSGACSGMVVRKGEYWQVWAYGDLECVFTPFL